MQKHEDRWAPVANASKSISEAERRYAQIEKEALASTFACDRFLDYILGKDILLETDHKPLIPLLSTKDLDQLPVRIQRMRMKLMRYSFTPIHVPGKNLNTADTLSGSPIDNKKEYTFYEELELYANHILKEIPITNSKLEESIHHQQEDEVCRQIMIYASEGWPDKHLVKGLVGLYYAYRAEMTVVGGLLMMGTRVVIPSAMKLDVLDRIHEGHQGIVKCKALARNTVWWPEFMKNIEELIENCRRCQANRKNHPEPLMPTKLPQRPWQYIATDVYEVNGKQYIVLVDYYSRWIELATLQTTTSKEVIDRMKRVFSRFGIPDQVRSDNASYYTSKEFKLFTNEYGFRHLTSSPGHSSGNGEAERAVQTVKILLSGSKDTYLVLLNYRATPLSNGYSPAELMMGRRLNTKVPVAACQLSPIVIPSQAPYQLEENKKTAQKINFDRRHTAKPLITLQKGDEVVIPDRRQSGIVIGNSTPRSYIIETDTGSYRRNRVHLNKMPSPRLENSKSTEINQDAKDLGPAVLKETVTKSGRVSKPPAIYNDYV
nr:uncharacterized protein K02A2.6-like [Lepeophtheirus salmonis]